MPQVSKYPLYKDVYIRIENVFSKTVAKLTTPKKVDEFLYNFFTPTEKVMFAKRLGIAFLLAKKYDYRSISKLLKVSTSTVSRVAYIYNNKPKFRKYVHKIIKEEEFDEFLTDLADKIASVLASGKSKSGSWIYLRNEIQKKKSNRVF